MEPGALNPPTYPQRAVAALLATEPPYAQERSPLLQLTSLILPNAPAHLVRPLFVTVIWHPPLLERTLPAPHSILEPLALALNARLSGRILRTLTLHVMSMATAPSAGSVPLANVHNASAVKTPFVLLALAAPSVLRAAKSNLVMP